MKAVYNIQYDFLGVLNEDTGLVRIQEQTATIFMVYIDGPWELIGEL